MADDSSSPAFSGRYLDVIWENGCEYTRNRRARGVVLVIALTEAQEIIFIEQYRVPLKSMVIEYPAGLVGDEAGSREESFESAARRELLEESGYEAGEMQLLLRGPSSPGSSTEIVDFYLARNARRIHTGGGVEHERIHVHAVKLAAADAFLEEKTRQGVLVDPRVYLGVHCARKCLHGSIPDTPR